MIMLFFEYIYFDLKIWLISNMNLYEVAVSTGSLVQTIHVCLRNISVLLISLSLDGV